jgi:hypothetical protein
MSSTFGVLFLSSLFRAFSKNFRNFMDILEAVGRGGVRSRVQPLQGSCRSQTERALAFGLGRRTEGLSLDFVSHFGSEVWLTYLRSEF